MSHNFHFVLNKRLKNNIIDFAVAKKMSISGAVVFIFNFMKPVLEKHLLKDVCCISGGYSCLDAETDLHVFFKETDYKYLKQIQSNLYCFSMALVLRWVLNEFFEGLKSYGFKRFSDVVCRFGNISLRSFRKNFLKNPKKQHMFSCIKNFDYISHIFDHEYNLITTKFT